MFIVYLQLFTYNTIFNIIQKIHNNSLICMYMHTHNHTHRCVTNYIYTCTAQWYRKMCTLGVFGTLFWQTGRFWKPPHFRAHFLKGNYVDTFFQVARFCAAFSLVSPFPTRAQTYTSRSALMRKHLTGFEALLGLVAFTLCFVKDEWGTNDVTDVQLLICARFPRV